MRNVDFDQMCVDVKHTLQNIQHMKSQKMAEYGLKGSTAHCLCSIAKSEQGLNAGELSDRLNIDKAQISRCMAELIQRGFVFRNEEGGKQYRQRYCLTETGNRVAGDIIKTSTDIGDRISIGIEAKDMVAFYRVWEILRRNSAELSSEK